MYEMKIFNEDLEKHLLFDEIDNCSTYIIPSIVVFFGIYSVISFIVCDIIFNVLIAMRNYPISYFFQGVVVLLGVIFLLNLPHVIAELIDKILEPAITPSNPILIKLKNAAKQKDRVNLVKLWKHFNPDNLNNSIMLTKEQKNIELLQKLDDDLVRFIENTDDVTIKLFNLDDFESYQQLYMKYIAPKQKEEVVNKIQTLMRNNHLDNQTNHLTQKLHLLKNKIEEYDIDTADYFEFKKWHKDILDMLKLDKDNDMVKNNYQNIIQEINKNKKD